MADTGAAKGAELTPIPLHKPEWALVGRIGSTRAQECYE
jgi:hypothetical protein